MPCGLEPHQYDLHEHLFRGRHAGHIPLGRRMGALRLAGRRGCRSAALRRLAVAHAPQRKIVPHRAARYGPPPYSGRTPGIRHNRPQALPHTPAASRSASAEPLRFCRCVRMLSSLRLQPPLAPVSVRECRPASPQPKAKPDSRPVSRFTGRSGSCIPADSAGHPDPMSSPEARTTRKRPPKDTNSSIYQLIRLKFAGGGNCYLCTAEPHRRIQTIRDATGGEERKG